MIHPDLGNLGFNLVDITEQVLDTEHFSSIGTQLIDNLKSNLEESGAGIYQKKTVKILDDHDFTFLFFRKVKLMGEGTETAVIGFDHKTFRWYGNDENSLKFNKWLSNVEWPQLEDNMQKNRNSPAIFDALKEIKAFFRRQKFVPPFFAKQKFEIDQFISTPRAVTSILRPNISSVTPDQTLPQFFQSVFSANRGLYWGHQPKDILTGMLPLLLHHLEDLKQCNVKHIYDEISAVETISLFEQFNHNPRDDGSRLKAALESLEVVGVDARIELYKAARNKGIEVWPINCGTLKVENDQAARMRYNTEGMLRNVDHFSQSLRDREKFLVLGKFARHQVATKLGIPDILCYESEGTIPNDHGLSRQSHNNQIAATLYRIGNQLTVLSNSVNRREDGASRRDFNPHILIEFLPNFQDQTARVMPNPQFVEDLTPLN